MAKGQQDRVTPQGEEQELEQVSLTSDQEPGTGDLDPDTLDPDMDYRWVYEGGNKIAKRLAKGYMFVRRSEQEVAKLQPGGEQGADDFIRDGDRILMMIPKTRHDAMMKRTAQISRARLAAPKGQFRKKAQQGGVNVNTTKE